MTNKYFRNLCVLRRGYIAVGRVFRENFPESRPHPPLSYFLLSPHHHSSGEPSRASPGTQTDKTRDNQKEDRAGSLPAVGGLALGRRNSCCPAAHCSLLSTAGEKGVVSDGWTHRLVLTLPRPSRDGLALLQESQDKILLDLFQRQILPYQQVHFGISKFHPEVTPLVLLGEGKVTSLHRSPPEYSRPSYLPEFTPDTERLYLEQPALHLTA